MIRQDILEKQAKIVYLGIGSNLGNRFKNIEKAKINLTENQVTIIKSSSYYETLAWTNINDPKFLNIVENSFVNKINNNKGIIAATFLNKVN